MIGVAVVGAGHWGPNLLRNLHNHRTSAVLWAVDRDERRLAALAAGYPDVRLGNDFEAALADPAVQAVAVATPTSTHYALTRRALEAGKHVLVEKPVATSVREAEELAALSEERGLVLLVGHVFLYNRAVQKARKYIEQGELGRVYYIGMVRTNLGPIRGDVNAAWDLAAHDISIASYWLDAEPTAVSATGGSWINPGVEDVVFATFEYPGDVLVNLHASWLHPRKTRDVAVVGDRKMLTFDDMNPQEPLRIYDRHVGEELSPGGLIDTFHAFRGSIQEGDVLIPRISTGEPLRAECEEFLACIAERRSPLVDGRRAAAVVRALEAVQRSLAAGGRKEAV